MKSNSHKIEAKNSSAIKNIFSMYLNYFPVLEKKSASIRKFSNYLLFPWVRNLFIFSDEWRDNVFLKKII